MRTPDSSTASGNEVLLLSIKPSSASETEKQLESAQTIHASGADLLALINEILDLAKIDEKGMHLGKPFAGVTGILSGQVQHVGQPEADPVGQMFGEGDGGD